MEFYNFSSKSSSAEFFAVFPTVHDVAALLTRHTHELSKNNDETRQFSVFSLPLSLCVLNAKTQQLMLIWGLLAEMVHCCAVFGLLSAAFK